MDDKKICFIMCCNDELYKEECLYYISKLDVPDGYRIDIKIIKDARSMTSGYNSAMRQSDAKYKIYLHQDTFLINSHILYEALNVFDQDERIGMLGVIGAPEFSGQSSMWKTERYGQVYDRHIKETSLIGTPVEDIFMQVEVIDGLFMMTQYDVTWREDLFDKWDMYDASQSQEFIRHGYKVVVPRMEQPWCLHDCGFLNLKNYAGERRKFLKEYRERV